MMTFQLYSILGMLMLNTSCNGNTDATQIWISCSFYVTHPTASIFSIRKCNFHFFYSSSFDWLLNIVITNKTSLCILCLLCFVVFVALYQSEGLRPFTLIFKVWSNVNLFQTTAKVEHQLICWCYCKIVQRISINHATYCHTCPS